MHSQHVWMTHLFLHKTYDSSSARHQTAQLDADLHGSEAARFNIASRVGNPVYTQAGTPPYQAPDSDLTRWEVSTDLFAVGVVLYQFLCDGNHPYPNSRPMVAEAVIDSRTIRSDLTEFLIKACGPVDADRFSTADEMQLALRKIRILPLTR